MCEKSEASEPDSGPGSVCSESLLLNLDTVSQPSTKTNQILFYLILCHGDCVFILYNHRRITLVIACRDIHSHYGLRYYSEICQTSGALCQPTAHPGNAVLHT